MGLIEQEIKELRQLRRDHQSGKIDSEKVSAQIAIYSQIEKRVRLYMQAYSISAKYGGRHMRKMITANMVGEDEAIVDIDLDPETERIKCPGKDFDLITRHDCLDLSGSNAFAECSTCEHFSITRKRILGDKPK